MSTKLEEITSIELNEINFQWVKHYINNGELGNFNKLFSNFNICETKSEDTYQDLEPWIQWPSYYTCLPLSEHKCFNLGEGKLLSKKSIYSIYQNMGYNVLALSPMNLTFKEENDSILLPDPWTGHDYAVETNLTKLWRSISKIVNQNASGAISLRDYYSLSIGFIRYARIKHYLKYIRLLMLSLKYKWAKAIILDLLLFDIFRSIKKSGCFQYSSIFLNAGAHIQHHHLYDSDCYQGKNMNPKSYSPASQTKIDPIYEILKIYDYIIGETINEGSRVLFTSGLQQKENETPYYQYRPINHTSFYKEIGFKFKKVSARMSRDVSLTCETISQQEKNIELCNKIKINGMNLFDYNLENNTGNLFIRLAWRGNINSFEKVLINGKEIDIKNKIVLVSIENAIHQTAGWHIDTKANHGLKNAYIWDIHKNLVRDLI